MLFSPTRHAVFLAIACLGFVAGCNAVLDFDRFQFPESSEDPIKNPDGGMDGSTGDGDGDTGDGDGDGDGDTGGGDGDGDTGGGDGDGD
ncbi:MAG: hypothetical protein OXR73_01690, partial [Myxococcales bacterium]|nr:hypothetical protein [Myxococcales bacterium]